MNDQHINKLVKIAGIIASKKLGDIPEKDEKEFQSWLKLNKSNRELYQRLLENEQLFASLQEPDSFNKENSWQKISAILDNASAKANGRRILPGYFRYAAAAILLISAGIVAFLLFYKPRPTDQVFAAELKPGSQKAILITSDQQEIILGEGNKKRIIQESTARLTDTSQLLIYEKSTLENLFSSAPEYNTVITPKGGEYSMMLSDGTRIRLNADSKIRFPVTFSGDQRIVELEGEAYFEVAHSKKQVFLVQTPSMEIRVYGTRFNVSAYNEDPLAHTTLVEGKVGVLMHDKEFGIDPGEQVCLKRESGEVEIKQVNTDLYTSWTRGLFVFENEELESILMKLSRWYDFEIVFESDELKQIAFTGDLKRYDEIQTILDMISMASDIQFRTEENRIVVCKK